MLLGYLNDNCKEDVMDLAIYVALANAVLEKNEEESLEQYFRELGIEKREISARNSLEKTIKNVCECTSLIERKMIVFELTAMACVDGVCDDMEQRLLEQICEAFEIHISEIESMKLMVSKLYKIYIEIAELIGKEELLWA